MNTKKYISGALALATVAGWGFALPLFADATTIAPPSGWTQGQGGMMRGSVKMMRPTITGTVASVSGNILTVTVKHFAKPVSSENSGGNETESQTVAGQAPATSAAGRTTTTYTVDAGNATVMKAGVISAVSAIAVGDTISAQGTLTGTNVVATSIRDGVMPRGQNDEGKAGGSAGANANAGINLVAGNGQPIVGGAITAISGNTLTVTNKSNVTYTVDATSAKFLQGSTTIAVSGVKVGDQVVVQGTVNGTSVTASTVIDQAKPAGASTSAGNNGKHLGFFGNIGSFFAHLFGF